MRWVGLGRVSTTKQGPRFGENVYQKVQCEQWCKSRDDTLVKWVDTQESTKKPLTKRYELLRILDDLERGVYDGLICSTQERLVRNVAEYMYINELALEQGWQLAGVDGTYDWHDPEQWAFAMMKMVWAEKQRRTDSKKMTQWHGQRRAKGIRPGVKPTCPQPVRDLVEQLYAQGWGPTRIATHLNSIGEPTLVPPSPKMPRAKKWSFKTIINIHNQSLREQLPATEVPKEVVLVVPEVLPKWTVVGQDANWITVRSA